MVFDVFDIQVLEIPNVCSILNKHVRGVLLYLFDIYDHGRGFESRWGFSRAKTFKGVFLRKGNAGCGLGKIDLSHISIYNKSPKHPQHVGNTFFDQYFQQVLTQDFFNTLLVHFRLTTQLFGTF